MFDIMLCITRLHNGVALMDFFNTLYNCIPVIRNPSRLEMVEVS